jgi:hypothetical protein
VVRVTRFTTTATAPHCPNPIRSRGLHCQRREVPPPVSIVTSSPSLDCVDITTEAKATSSSSIKPDGLYLPLSLTISLLISMMFYSLISNTSKSTH